jgi:hypothetical protein
MASLLVLSFPEAKQHKEKKRLEKDKLGTILYRKHQHISRSTEAGKAIDVIGE